jgi:hypothetical protein
MCYFTLRASAILQTDECGIRGDRSIASIRYSENARGSMRFRNSVQARRDYHTSTAEHHPPPRHIGSVYRDDGLSVAARPNARFPTAVAAADDKQKLSEVGWPGRRHAWRRFCFAYEIFCRVVACRLALIRLRSIFLG